MANPGAFRNERSLHWDYFLSLEEDLLRSVRFVEPVEDNFVTYSTEFAGVILGAASEVDVVLKGLCRKVNPQTKAYRITEYREELASFARWDILVSKVSAPRWPDLSFDPWGSWRERGETPQWWKDYNKVKHQRDQHFSKANLLNAWQAMSALFLSCIAYYRQIGATDILPPSSCFAANRDIARVWLDEGMPTMCIDPQRIAVMDSRRSATIRMGSYGEVLGKG